MFGDCKSLSLGVVFHTFGGYKFLHLGVKILTFGACISYDRGL